MNWSKWLRRGVLVLSAFGLLALSAVVWGCLRAELSLDTEDPLGEAAFAWFSIRFMGAWLLQAGCLWADLFCCFGRRETCTEDALVIHRCAGLLAAAVLAAGAAWVFFGVSFLLQGMHACFWCGILLRVGGMFGKRRADQQSTGRT